MANTIAITDNLTGNVGSCKVEKTTVNVSMFQVQDIATNSCTGEVTNYPVHIPGDMLFPFFLLILIISLNVWYFKSR